MDHRRSTVAAVLLLGALTGACTSGHDAMSLLPISEQAYLRTQVPQQPDNQPISVAALLQKALGQDTTGGAEGSAVAVAAPRVIELDLSDACEQPLSGEHLVAIGHYRSGLEGSTGLAGRIQVAAGITNLCGFQRAEDVARLLDGVLVDMVIETDTELAPGHLRVIAEPLA